MPNLEMALNLLQVQYLRQVHGYIVENKNAFGFSNISGSFKIKIFVHDFPFKVMNYHFRLNERPNPLECVCVCVGVGEGNNQFT